MMIGGGLMPCRWPCLFLPNWECFLMIIDIFRKCMICICTPKPSMAIMVCTIRKMVFGGVMPILIPHIPSLTERTVIGQEVMDGSMPPWYGYWILCPKMHLDMMNT